MTASADRQIAHLGPQPDSPKCWRLPAVAAATYYTGVMLVTDATQRLAKYTAGTARPVAGLYIGKEYTAAATDEIEATPGWWRMKNSSGDPVTIADHGKIVYGEDDETIAKTDNGGTLSPVGLMLWINGAPYVAVGVDPGVQQAVVLALAASASAAAISAGLLTLDGEIFLFPNDFVLATGEPMAAFAGGASSVPGLNLTDSKAFTIRWNNDATPDPVLARFAMPDDVDITANMVMEIYASKSGATLADAVTFKVEAFNQVLGALHDADADFGGTSSAMTGDAAAKTIQKVTRTLALANLAANAGVTITVQPTDGTIGTDDVMIHWIRITYTKKLAA